MINRDYTFQNYLIGDNNKAAIDAISSAMILPGRIHNPIFIYGAIGVGKTHLLQALAQEYRKESKIRYVAAEQLVNEMVKAIRNDRYVDFLKQGFQVDVLLVDDIDFIKDKKSTLKELLQIFKRLYNAQKQIVITADRPIMQIFKTKSKIFQKELTLKIDLPSYDERLRFLQAKAQTAGLRLGSDVFEDIAHNARPDFRELEGALAKAKHYVLL